MVALYSFVFAAIFAFIDGLQNRQVDIYRKGTDKDAEKASMHWHTLNLVRNLLFILSFSHGWREMFLSFSIFLLISDGIINAVRGYRLSFVGTKNNSLDTDTIWIWLKEKGINQYVIKIPIFLTALIWSYI